MCTVSSRPPEVSPGAIRLADSSPNALVDAPRRLYYRGCVLQLETRKCLDEVYSLYRLARKLIDRMEASK